MHTKRSPGSTGFCVTPGTPSIAFGTFTPCQWMVVASGRRFVRTTRTRSPSFTRISGPGIRPLYAIAANGAPRRQLPGHRSDLELDLADAAGGGPPRDRRPPERQGGHTEAQLSGVPQDLTPREASLNHFSDCHVRPPSRLRKITPAVVAA
jgi:hypothetical protein